MVLVMQSEKRGVKIDATLWLQGLTFINIRVLVVLVMTSKILYKDYANFEFHVVGNW